MGRRHARHSDLPHPVRRPRFPDRPFHRGCRGTGARWGLGLHSHDQAEISYVLRGEVLLRLGGDEHPLRAGSAVFIPGGATHGVRNVGSTSARLFSTLAAGSFDEVQYVFTG